MGKRPDLEGRTVRGHPGGYGIAKQLSVTPTAINELLGILGIRAIGRADYHHVLEFTIGEGRRNGQDGHGPIVAGEVLVYTRLVERKRELLHEASERFF